MNYILLPDFNFNQEFTSTNEQQKYKRVCLTLIKNIAVQL